ncbi:MAG: alpha-galactosidase, partial [Clostridia bacterium]|nr:alpha-galactosidase [Clostridia bacterium]
STTNPGITANPGEFITFALQVNNHGTQSQIVELRIDSCPEEWQASLEGRGRKISQVFVSGQSSEMVDLKVQIPENAQEEVYTITVAALRGGSLLDSLKLTVNISETPAGEDRLKAQYSELKGPADATFNYKLSLTNNGTDEQAYSLGADIPQGWQISFKPSYEQQQVASITVAGGETKNLDVSITPAANVEAGEYTIPVYAISSSGRATAELKLIISGTYELNFSTPSGRLNTEIVAGRDQKVTLEVENSGSAPINNINFSAQAPDNWSVSFDPKTIDILNPGEKRQLTATITASNKAIAGDYVVAMKATANEAINQANFRVTVKTSTLWGIVGLVIVLLVCAGVYWVFHQYGRR